MKVGGQTAKKILHVIILDHIKSGCYDLKKNLRKLERSLLKEKY